jgi:hypothetical protein
LSTQRNKDDGWQGGAGMVSRTIWVAALIARRLVASHVLRQFILAGAGLVLLGAAGGCASITSGTSQSINVNSEPGEADCTLTRDGRELGTVRTPGPVKVKRESKSIHIVCKKEGYKDGETSMDARFETATLGNLIVGGVVGLAVDAASGAYQRYDGFVMVHLAPLPPGAAVAQPTTPPAPAPPPPIAAAAAASRPVASTAGEGPAPAPIAPSSGLSRSRL